MASPGAVAEGQEPGEDLLDAIEVRRDLCVGKHLARFVLAGRIADLGGAAAHQRDGLVAGLLQPAQHHDLHERPRMQAGRCGIEADIAQ